MRNAKLSLQIAFTKDPVVRLSLVITFGLCVASCVALIGYYAQLPPYVPLFYSLIRGENQLVPKPYLSIIPILMFVFSLTHLVLARFNYDNDRIFARILSASASLVVFLFMVALAHILIIVV